MGKTAVWEGIQEHSWFWRWGSSIATCDAGIWLLLVPVFLSKQVKMDEQKGTDVSAMLQMLLPLKRIQSEFYFVGATVSHGLLISGGPSVPQNFILAEKNYLLKLHSEQA